MRPFRQLPWLHHSARMPYKHHADTEEAVPPKETVKYGAGDPANGIFNDTVSPSLAAWTLGILALTCVTLFSLAWLGKLP